MPRRLDAGFALLTVLILFALIGAIAGMLLHEQYFALRRAVHRAEQIQAEHYALAGEELARQLLEEDFRKNPQEDYPGEPWAAVHTGFKIDNGELAFAVKDAQGVFNLNRLRGNDPAIAATFAALLASLKINPAIADEAADWVDENAAPRRRGAESQTYLKRRSPYYRTPDAAMGSPSELALLASMKEESFRALLPFVSALPEAVQSINVNSASEEVLRALLGDRELAGKILRQRRGARKIGVDDLEAMIGARKELSVHSTVFNAYTRARYGRTTVWLVSTLYRSASLNKGKPVTIARDFSQRFDPASVVTGGIK